MSGYEDLQEKVAIVTGANGGMGLAVSQALVDSGAWVVAADLQTLPDPLLARSKRVTYLQTDVSDETQVQRLVGATLSQHHQLDCAVNAAAVEFEHARLHECRTQDFDRLMQVNLRGLFLCMKHEITAMLGSDGAGSIVNLASTTSFQTEKRQPAYGASKHGVLGLTRQAALDYAADDIRVNGIAPGNIDTPMLQKALDRRGIEASRVEKHMLLGRFGRVEEIAEASLWLCSDRSSFTTGHVLAVEGGMLLT